MKSTTTCIMLMVSYLTSAAVPIRWTVETSRAQPALFDAYHGETLDLAAAFQSYGSPLAITGPASLYYQTNGMGAAWWTAPATVSSNTISAAFTPSLDPGATTLNCFLGGPSSSYRASFRMRFLNSPGATPNVLPLPLVTAVDIAAMIDTAVGGTNTLTHGGPYLPLTDRAAAADLITDGISTISPDLSYESTTVVHDGIKVEFWRPDGTQTTAYFEKDNDDLTSFGNGAWSWNDDYGYWEISEYQDLIGGAPGYSGPPDVNYFQTFYTDDSFSVAVGTVMMERYVEYKDISGKLALTNDIPTSASDVGAYPSDRGEDLESVVNWWQTFWGGDAIRVTVTNYYGQTGTPHLYIEERMDPDDDHTDSWYKVVWDEMTRWGLFLSGYQTLTNHVYNDLADRAWGVYDSETGDISPDGILQISTPHIMVAAGLSYQQTVTSGGGEVWVLTVTDPTIVGGQTEAGYLDLKDGDGNSIFKVVKGNRRTIGATATGVSSSDAEFLIHYNVVSDDPPALEMCTNLIEGNWHPAAVTWTGASGAYIAHAIKPQNSPSAFYRATYEVGGETYISNAAPMSVQSGILCTDGTHKIRPVYNGGNITWEIVP